MTTYTLKVSKTYHEALRVHHFNFGTEPRPDHQAVWLRMLADWLDSHPEVDYIWQIRFYPEREEYDLEVMVREGLAPRQ